MTSETAPAEDEAGGLLEHARRTEFRVGSNVRGTAGGNWVFLLPSLNLGRVLCCGRPSPAAHAMLTALAQEVHVAPPAAIAAHALAPGSVDVVWVARRLRPFRSPAAQALDRLLSPTGVVFAEARLPAVEELLPSRTALWTAPRRAEVRVAVPEAHGRAIDWVQRRGLTDASCGRLGRAAARLPVWARPSARARPRGQAQRVLYSRAPGQPGHGGGSGHRRDGRLPAYLLQIAAAAGLDLEARAWTLWAPGPYASKKILFFVFDAAGRSPEIVVRLTRGAALNLRLENEWNALNRLAELSIDDVPRPRFLGAHRGLRVLGESAVDGEPFERRCVWTAECAYGRAALDRLIDLGTRTAGAPYDPDEVAQALEDLLARFTRTYRLRPAHQERLAEAVSMLSSGAHRLPSVLQHGDPGPWNMVVTGAGAVGVLDWEACEQRGMPLWDLLYFMRSYAVRAARAEGIRDRVAGFARHFFGDSSVNRLLADAVGRFCTRTGLAADLVEPLLLTCWMHRALKESTRLAPGRLDRGDFVRLLRCCLDARESPGLRRAVAAAAAAGP